MQLITLGYAQADATSRKCLRSNRPGRGRRHTAGPRPGTRGLVTRHRDRNTKSRSNDNSIPGNASTLESLRLEISVRFDLDSEYAPVNIPIRVAHPECCDRTHVDTAPSYVACSLDDLDDASATLKPVGRRQPSLVLPRQLIRLALGAMIWLLVSPASNGASFRYANSANRIYVENGGSATLTDIKAALPNAPLDIVDAANGIWLLRANLFVTDGCTLMLHGNTAGGDVNELRLLSNDSTPATNGIVSMDADWGTLELNSTRVTSWNQTLNGPDTEYQLFRRAFIRARSRKVGSGIHQSSLNVMNSDIGYLGFDDAEGHGLTWQVVGSVDEVRVLGTVIGSRIHHCQLGVNTWAVDDVNWIGNEISFNKLYGFDASDAGHQSVLAANSVHDNDYAPVFRWASASWRIYVSGQGIATLSQIKAAVPQAPLQLVDPVNKVWFLGANLFVDKGARLLLYGPAIGGDVSVLRLKSDNNTRSNAFVELRADWGYLDIRNTRITSWDSAVNGPDTETDLYRRAYVRARSTLDPDGVTAHESRMDVINSDIGYLGSHNTEAYGLTWKVVDTTAVYLPAGTTNTLFDVVNVYGDIMNSRLHHNYFGMYSYGHYGGRWINNEVDHNLGYGFDPHDDSDYLVIENNNVHDNGLHGIIASKRCDHGILRNNRSWSNGRDPFGLRGNGLMLHRSCNDWVVEGNQSYGNVDSGIAIFASSRNLVRDNLCVSNGNAGIRLSVGAAGNWVAENDFTFNAKYGLYLYEGNDPPEPDDNDPLTAGRPRHNTFVNNFVQHYGPEALKVDNGDANEFLYNHFVGTNATLRFASSTDNAIISNLFPANVVVKLNGSTTNRNATLIKGAPPVKLDLDQFSTAQFEDDNCAIFDSAQGRLQTVADSSGSFALVTLVDLGGVSGTVFARDLRVVPNRGGVLVTPQLWNMNRQVKISWTAQTSDPAAIVRYTVGGLASGVLYSVTDGSSSGRGNGRGNRTTSLTTLAASSQGSISFNMQRGTTATYTYSVINR